MEKLYVTLDELFLINEGLENVRENRVRIIEEQCISRASKKDATKDLEVISKIQKNVDNLVEHIIMRENDTEYKAYKLLKCFIELYEDDIEVKKIMEMILQDMEI